MAVDPLTRRVWVLHGNGGVHSADVFDTTNGDLVLVDSFALPGFVPIQSSIVPLPGGDAIVTDGLRVLRLDANANPEVTTVATAVGDERIQSASRRPDVDEVWEVRSNDNAVMDFDAALVVRGFDGIERSRIELGPGACWAARLRARCTDEGL